MATLAGFGLRSAAALGLVIAIAALCPALAGAQPADSPDSVATTGAGNSDQPAAADVQRPTGSASTDSTSADPGDSAAGDSADSEEKSATSADEAPSGQDQVHTALKSFNHMQLPSGDGAFDHASELFPAFCKDWQRKLHDRELNNVENISWKEQNGWQTGTYTSYSPVKTCNCKLSTGGVPIGELTYQETEYYLAGHTVEEARHAQPKLVGVTNTTEIFRWDKDKWDDGR